MGNPLANQIAGGLLFPCDSLSALELFRKITALAVLCKRQPIPPITKTEPGDPALTFNV